MADCGVVCLSIILDYYHGYIDFNRLKEMCAPSTRGLSFEEIIEAAVEYGLIGRKQIYTADTIKEIHHPVIILMGHQHYMQMEHS